MFLCRIAGAIKRKLSWSICPFTVSQLTRLVSSNNRNNFVHALGIVSEDGCKRFDHLGQMGHQAVPLHGMSCAGYNYLTFPHWVTNMPGRPYPMALSSCLGTRVLYVRPSQQLLDCWAPLYIWTGGDKEWSARTQGFMQHQVSSDRVFPIGWFFKRWKVSLLIIVTVCWMVTRCH